MKHWQIAMRIGTDGELAMAWNWLGLALLPLPTCPYSKARSGAKATGRRKRFARPESVAATHP